jgi:predicted regulator of Ras-like GTPase activity (Roadblock/LC7/MglB family)
MNGSPFARILEEVVRELPGAVGAIFVDWEGEAVDAFTHGDEIQIRLLGAHWTIIYYQLKSALEKLGMQAPAEVVLRFADQQIVIRRITDEYLAIISMADQTHLGRAMGLMRAVEGRLRQEM